jgi:hypothetical protein
MNDKYGMNDNNYANVTNEGWDKGPANTTQTGEAGQEETKEWQEQAPTQVAVESAPLTWLSAEEINELQTRWNSIQAEFVDEPHKSVEQADALVAEALERIKQVFSNQHTVLNEQWINHEDISTEDLRVALKSYRSFFKRILAF